jgi:hypothetical protein
LGLRRIDRVLIEIGDIGVRCRAFGTTHRLPVVRRISLLVAMELADDGVPTTVLRPASAASGLPPP